MQLKTLKSLSNTRWACRAEAVSAVLTNYSILLPTIDEICENTHLPDTRAKGIGLKHQLKYFNFVFTMNVMEPILRATLKVSIALQATELDLLNAVEIVKGLKKFISEMRINSQEFGKIYKTVINICSENNIDIPKVDKRKVSRKIDDNQKNQVFANNKYDEIRLQIYYPILDDLLGEIDNRFMNTILELMSAVGKLTKLQPNDEDYFVLKDVFNISIKDLETEVKLLLSIENVPIGTSIAALYKWLDWLVNSNKKNIFVTFYEVITYCKI